MEMGTIALGDIWHFSKDRPSKYGTSCARIRAEVSNGVAQMHALGDINYFGYITNKITFLND
jgi:hypothetical protein